MFPLARSSRRKVKAVLLSLGAVTVAVAVPVGTASPASAAVTCSGTGCNGLDPDATGCSAGATTLASAAIYDTIVGSNIGTVELRWSPTCKTNWGRATMSIDTQVVASWAVGAVLQDGTHVEYLLQARLHPGSVNWSDMIYAPVQYAYGWSSLAFTDPAGVKHLPEGYTVWAG